MRAKFWTYLPWGERAGLVAFWAFPIGLVGFFISALGHLLGWLFLAWSGYVVVVGCVFVGIVYVLFAIPRNALGMWRTLRENWNRPPVDQHKDWRP